MIRKNRLESMTYDGGPSAKPLFLKQKIDFVRILTGAEKRCCVFALRKRECARNLCFQHPNPTYAKATEAGCTVVQTHTFPNW